MSNKNSLANKKRKRIKFDATSGSISGFLLSSSDGIQINNSSDNSLDEPEVFEKLKPLKARLSLEFDDSFDLFASKKLLKKDLDETVSSKTSSPCKNSNGSSPSKNFNSGSNPCKNSNSGSPRGKNKDKQKTIKKCDYFNQPFAIPCPFCFKFEEEIFTHISKNCIKPSCISDSMASKLIEIHTKYWKERRSLGIPDGTYNEAEVFKPIVSQGRKLPEANSDLSNDCKIPVLKWTSKMRKSKYLLLRQSQSERESKITQKLAIVLMGSETEGTSKPTEDLFLTVDKDISSDLLSSLLEKELTFWKKSSLGPDESNDEVYYIKALAPFIAPKAKTTSRSASSADLDKNKDEHEIVSAFIPKNESKVSKDSNKPCLPQKESGSIQNSQMKDSCFTETQFSQSSINNCKKHKSTDCFQETLSRNWEKMFNYSDLSDMTVLFCDGHFLGHSLVFYAYSMKIFRSISSSSDEESGKLLDWKDISSVVGKAYIKYIYCGITDHFNKLDCSDLESILCMCNKYDDVYLEALIADLMLTKKSLEESNDRCYSKRNLTSPDIFDGIDSGDELNFDYKINVNSETVSNLNVSKRKLELSPEYLDSNDSIKRIKSISPVQSDDNFINNTNLDDNDSLKCRNLNSGCNQDEVISISSEDKVSVCSGVTMSPGRYEKSSRPLSQCSTLPPLLESPKAEDKPESLSSPPMFPDSPIEECFEKSDNIKEKEDLLDPVKTNEGCVDNCKQVSDDNRYYDHDFFDYNNYTSTSWPENIPEDMNSDSDQLEKEMANPLTKHSIDKYFDDSLPTELLLENSEVHCKTPQSVNKSIKGSPLYQSTPTGPTSTATSNNTSTPSPHIVISDKATPMLNYSNIVTPELKGELRKYGLKPEMDRKKAKALLRYIYDSIHPVVSDSNSEDLSPLPNDNITLRRTGMDEKVEDRSNMDSPNIHKPELGKINTSTESILASDSESMKEEGSFDFDCLQEEVLCSQDSSSYLNKSKLLQAVSDFIKRDKVLFESILQYVPIWLSKFHQALKENNIKCTKIDLMDVLDELCITFRTERKVREKKPPKR